MKIFVDEDIEERYAQGLYEDYLKEQINQKDKEIERLNKIIYLIKNNIDITIQIIKEQPTGNDEWLLERLNGIKNIGSDK